MTDVKVKTNATRVKREIQAARSELPEVERDLAEEMMEEAIEEVRNSAKIRFNNFRGGLLNQIDMNNVREVSSGDGKKLSLKLSGKSESGVDYIAWNEFAEKGHYVPVTQDNSPIQEWVDENYRFDDDPDFLFVEPTSFVEPVLPRIRSRIENRIESGNNSLNDFVRRYED